LPAAVAQAAHGPEIFSVAALPMLCRSALLLLGLDNIVHHFYKLLHAFSI